MLPHSGERYQLQKASVNSCISQGWGKKFSAVGRQRISFTCISALSEEQARWHPTLFHSSQLPGSCCNPSRLSLLPQVLCVCLPALSLPAIQSYCPKTLLPRLWITACNPLESRYARREHCSNRAFTIHTCGDPQNIYSVAKSVFPPLYPVFFNTNFFAFGKKRDSNLDEELRDGWFSP